MTEMEKFLLKQLMIINLDDDDLITYPMYPRDPTVSKEDHERIHNLVNKLWDDTKS